MMSLRRVIELGARHGEAFVLIAAAHVLIEGAGWDRARRFSDRLLPQHTPPIAPTCDPQRVAGAIERSVLRASRLIPGARCAPRALAARHMLARRGIVSRLVVGLRLKPHPEGHAWLELGSPAHPLRLFARDPSAYTPLDALSPTVASSPRSPIPTPTSA
ncbi:lasso peptide biosynthesis B2 protein [Lujinxingia vulgaris]|uniref:Lasso peptide biosynthesis B2 protein n=1 Tax=Lujinxingia vulgaris TaxID=2600176 RepID=A0A5C6XAL4_9DELT|nr:lasso peptide biosynthesis B2 protein [Lujinxingia vulgaris]TXD35105.1 lasso peptide biosynthesis B2 protein [Lujinxingia vulgaris]